MSFEHVDNLHHHSLISSHYTLEKNKGLGGFMILCHLFFQLCKSIVYLDTSNVYTVRVRATQTNSDETYYGGSHHKRACGMLYDVLVRDESFILLTDFFILDCEDDFKVSINLGRLVLVIRRTLVDIEIR